MTIANEFIIVRFILLPQTYDFHISFELINES